MCLCLASASADAAEQFVDSPYQEPLPDDPCDTLLTPSVATTTGLLEQMLNDPARRVFCVAPGDYRAAGRINLFPSGTAEQPRIIRYDATNDVRNAAQRGTQATFERMVLLGSYWVIHGLNFHPRLADSTWFFTIWGGDHVILDGNVFDGIDQPNAGGGNIGIMVAGYQGDPATYNSIQNNVVRNGNATYQDADYEGIQISEGKTPTEANDFNKVLDNEIYDWGDGVTISGHKDDCTELAVQHGTIVDGNDVYLTAAKRIDCTTGALDPAGQCACAEDGIGTKSDPGADPALYTRISNNRIWGMRPTSAAGHCGGSGSNGQGIGAGSFCPGHTLVARNVVSDVTIGIGIGGASWIVTGNLLNEIRESNGRGPYGTVAIDPDYFSSNLEIQFNTVVGSDASYDDQSSYTDTRCNAVFEDRALPGAAGNRGASHTTAYNYLYQSVQPNFEGATNVSLPLPEESGNTPYCYWRKRWTGPEQICIPFGATHPTSMHMAAAAECNEDLTVPFGLGQTGFVPEPGAVALAATSAAVLAAIARRRRERAPR